MRFFSIYYGNNKLPSNKAYTLITSFCAVTYGRYFMQKGIINKYKSIVIIRLLKHIASLLIGSCFKKIAKNCTTKLCVHKIMIEYLPQ